MRRYKYKIDDQFFDIIDSHEKAYLLGFIFADGCVRVQKRKNTESYQFRLKIHLKDKIIVEALKNLTNTDYPIKLKDNMCSISITNRLFVTNLILKGCVPRKTKILKYPNIDPIYDNSFILGYFDGDGSISISKKEWFNFNLLGTEDFLSSVKEILSRNEIYTSEPKKYKGIGEVYRMTIYSKESVIRLREFLYRDSALFLSRKKEIFDRIRYLKGKRVLSKINDGDIVKYYNKIPLNKISKLIGVSTSSIFRRIKKLRKAGILTEESIFRK